MKRVIVSADDFGLSEAVNEGIERAHCDGILTSASLMVAGAAAADAVERARRLPGLRVGLHLVVIEGPAVLPHGTIPDLVDAEGQFPSDQLGLGLRYAFSARVRRQLRDEIRAQFAAYAATGLTLDHLDAHKHMHLHPVVGHLAINAGLERGLGAVRIPAEPPDVMASCEAPPGFGARALHMWTSLLRHQAKSAGLVTNDAVFGLAWTGHMTTDRVQALLRRLPDGVSEIYFHPAAARDATIARLMPDYDHLGELAALTDPSLRILLQQQGIEACGYGDLPRT
jgi:hopanoid biosynthesis associated protein HpnK